MTTLLLTDDAMLQHDEGPGHPESPERLRAIRTALEEAPLPGVTWAQPSPAPRDAVARVHAPRYVDQIEALRGKSIDLDPDTHTSPGSVAAAFLSAGAALEAVTAVVQGKARRAFSLGRPPGHHAEPGRAMGFCLFNNVAIASEHARAALGVERVMIIDWDVHHGNGTQHAFEARRDVLVFDTHRFPFYPGTGALRESGQGEGEGFTVNVPLPAAMGDGDYAAVYADLLEPIANQFKPGLVLVSAGFDAHRDDPLADMDVTEDGFAHLCGVASRIADQVAGGRLVMLLEGGYNLTALARSVRNCVEVLTGSTPPPGLAPSARGRAALTEIIAHQRKYWRV